MEHIPAGVGPCWASSQSPVHSTQLIVLDYLNLTIYIYHVYLRMYTGWTQFTVYIHI